MSNNTNLPRRILTIVSLVVALIMEPFCLLWFSVGDFNEFAEMYHFLEVTFPALLAGIIVLVAGRSRWRWLLLLLLLPCAYGFFYEICDVYSMRSALNHRYR